MAIVVKCFSPDSKTGRKEFVGWIGGEESLFYTTSDWGVAGDLAKAYRFNDSETAKLAMQHLKEEQGECLLFVTISIDSGDAGVPGQDEE